MNSNEYSKENSFVKVPSLWITGDLYLLLTLKG